jgi:hypothetical protein
VPAPPAHARAYAELGFTPTEPSRIPPVTPPPAPSPLQSEEMIREADLDRDGKIGLEDFMRTVVL